MAKRVSYRTAVEAIALNDEPTCMDWEEMGGMASVVVVAVIFDKDQDAVARDVVAWRKADKIARDLYQDAITGTNPKARDALIRALRGRA